MRTVAAAGAGAEDGGDLIVGQAPWGAVRPAPAIHEP
jgi:hypothetical protein